MEQPIFTPRHPFSHKPDTKKIYDCIIVGTGVAGYSAAMYGARLGMKILLIGEVPGGTLALTGPVENYPGFVSINGQELMQNLENHAMDYDVDYLTDIVDSVSKGRMFTCVAGKKKYQGRTVIIATGARIRKLKVPGEDDFFGKGVYYCALCDLAHVKGKIAAVAGGGDSAVKEAILLSSCAGKVYIINNEKKIHPEKPHEHKINELIKAGKVELINGNQVVSIKGNGEKRELVLQKKYRGKGSVTVDGLFVYIGRIPESGIAMNLGVKITKKGEIIVNDRGETSIPGIFAAGDVTNTEWKQAIIAASQGVLAAYYANEYLIGSP